MSLELNAKNTTLQKVFNYLTWTDDNDCTKTAIYHNIDKNIQSVDNIFKSNVFFIFHYSPNNLNQLFKRLMTPPPHLTLLTPPAHLLSLVFPGIVVAMK